jgi:hypothetical protein
MPSRNACCTIFGCIFFIILSLLTIGSVLYTKNCDTYFTNYCSVDELQCTINNHYIYNEMCDYNDDDDDDLYYTCYQLVVDCIDTNNITCYTSIGYFNTYVDAVNYYNNLYYQNESMTAYILNTDDDGEICTFKNPYPHKNLGIFGFYAVGISILLFIITTIFFIIHCIKLRKEDNSVKQPLLQAYIDEELPKYE